MFPGVQIDSLQRKLTQQKPDLKHLVESRRSVGNGRRDASADFIHQDKEVEAKIMKARNSPQKIRLLHDIYLAHKEVKWKKRDLKTTECELEKAKSYEHHRKENLIQQDQLKSQVHNLISMCAHTCRTFQHTNWQT